MADTPDAIPAPKKKGGKLLILAGVPIALLGAGGGAAVYGMQAGEARRRA
jgi:flagellar FliL protein